MLKYMHVQGQWDVEEVLVDVGVIDRLPLTGNVAC